jgi:hypothetical protein
MVDGLYMTCRGNIDIFSGHRQKPASMAKITGHQPVTPCWPILRNLLPLGHFTDPDPLYCRWFAERRESLNKNPHHHFVEGVELITRLHLGVKLIPRKNGNDERDYILKTTVSKKYVESTFFFCSKTCLHPSEHQLQSSPF